MWACQGWGLLTVVGTAVALLPWFGFGVQTLVVADSCTDASEGEQRFWMLPTVLALALPIVFVISQRKRGPVGYVVVAIILVGLATWLTLFIWGVVAEPYDCD